MVYGPMPDRQKILIVEDDSDVAEVVARILNDDGYECSISSDGNSALHQISQIPFDLIILDRSLPGCSGDEALRELKHNPATSAIPVIMLTGKAEESDQLVGFALGVDDYVCKPFSNKVLLARVQSLLRRQRTSRLASSAVRQMLPTPSLTLDRMQFTACVGERSVELSKIEYRILATLMAASGHILDARTLLGLAIGKKDGAVELRIEPHIAALQQKLGPASRCIQEVQGAGYAFCSPETIPPGS